MSGSGAFFPMSVKKISGKKGLPRCPKKKK